MLKIATTEERAEIKRVLHCSTVDDWRDGEALAALNSPNAFEKLRNALNHEDHAVVMAILEHAPQPERSQVTADLETAWLFSIRPFLSQACQELTMRYRLATRR